MRTFTARLRSTVSSRGRSVHTGTEHAAAWAPDTVEIHPRQVRTGGGYAATLAVIGYPAEVSPGWLEPLLSYPGRLDVALHIDPVAPTIAAGRLRTQRARLESARRADAHRGRLDDPELDAAAEDAAELAARIARGEGRLFRVGLYLTVHAPTETLLQHEIAEVRSLAASMLLDARPVTWRALQGWTSTLPLAVDSLGMTRIFDTDALAAAFPFTSPDLPAPDPTRPGTAPGVLYGVNAASPGVVMWDRFGLDNHNSVVLARSGAGKSYFTKLELLRSLYQGIEAMVIDPEDEYTRLTDAVGGTTIRLGAAGVRLNPFDLPDPATALPDALTRQTLFGHTVIGVLLGQTLSPAEIAAIDRAILAAYHAVGITTDTRTWARPAPLLADVAATLRVGADPVSVTLADRLEPFISGSFSGLFDGPTTTQPTGHLVTFALRDLAEELRPVGTVLALDAIWRRVSNPRTRRRRLVIVDEAWLLLADGHGAQFLFRLAKSARKHWCGLTVVTQDAADVLSSDLGRAVVSNSATHVLLRQAPQVIDQVADAFGLTAGERAYLLAADRGSGLLSNGGHRVAFRTEASTVEHQIATTHPSELLDMLDEPDDGVPGHAAAATTPDANPPATPKRSTSDRPGVGQESASHRTAPSPADLSRPRPGRTTR